MIEENAPLVENIVWETLISLPLITQVLAIGFITVIVISVIELSYKVEKIGDAEK